MGPKIPSGSLIVVLHVFPDAAASLAVLDVLPAGAHMIASDDLYGGSFRLFERVRKQTTGLEVSFFVLWLLL